MAFVQQDIRNRLLENTITVIATDGLEKVTTKAIVKGTHINEAYIYRYFNSKEELIACVFETLDIELVNEVMAHLPIMEMVEMDYELRCRGYFHAIWRFLLKSHEKCLAYTRYYHSRYFEEYSAAVHRQRYQEMAKRFGRAFKSDANVWMLLKHVLSVMLDFASHVFSGDIPDNEDTAEHVFRLVYYSVQPYFKDHATKSA